MPTGSLSRLGAISSPSWTSSAEAHTSSLATTRRACNRPYPYPIPSTAFLALPWQTPIPIPIPSIANLYNLPLHLSAISSIIFASSFPCYSFCGSSSHCTNSIICSLAWIDGGGRHPTGLSRQEHTRPTAECFCNRFQHGPRRTAMGRSLGGGVDPHRPASRVPPLGRTTCTASCS